MSQLVAVAFLAAAGLISVAAGVTGTRAKIAQFEATAEEVQLAGPALAGEQVVWAWSRPSAQLFAVRAETSLSLYEPPEVPLPREFAHKGLYRPYVSQALEQPSGAASEVAVLRVATVRERRGREVTRAVPLFAEVRVGHPDGGPFRRLAGGRRQCPARQSWPSALDLSGRYLVFSERLATCKGQRELNRIVVVPRAGIGGRRRVIARSERSSFGPVAVSGRYVAWGQRRLPGKPREDSIVVYDLVTGKLAYRVPLGRLLPEMIRSVDVQSDGKVAAVVDRGSAHCPPRVSVVWATLSAPHPHVLPDTTARLSGTVRMRHDRLLFVRDRPGECGSIAADLVISDLAGSAQVLSSFDLPAGPLFAQEFDLDGARATYAESVELPPRGTERQFETAIYLDSAQ